MYRLWFESAMLAAESQSVIALRLMKLARGGKAAEDEAARMVQEKIVAAGEAARMMAAGASPEAIVQRYRRRVGANAARLRRSAG